MQYNAKDEKVPVRKLEIKSVVFLPLLHQLWIAIESTPTLSNNVCLEPGDNEVSDVTEFSVSQDRFSSN